MVQNRHLCLHIYGLEYILHVLNDVVAVVVVKPLSLGYRLWSPPPLGQCYRSPVFYIINRKLLLSFLSSAISRFTRFFFGIKAPAPPHTRPNNFSWQGEDGQAVSLTLKRKKKNNFEYEERHENVIIDFWSCFLLVPYTS